MPFNRNSKDWDYYLCPICGEKIKAPYFIYEPPEESFMIATLFGKALDHILENHCSSSTVKEDKK